MKSATSDSNSSKRSPCCPSAAACLSRSEHRQFRLWPSSLPFSVWAYTAFRFRSSIKPGNRFYDRPLSRLSSLSCSVWAWTVSVSVFFFVFFGNCLRHFGFGRAIVWAQTLCSAPIKTDEKDRLTQRSDPFGLPN